MSTIKVEHIDWDYGADSSTTTITSIGNLSDGFFRNTVQRRMTAGPTGSTGNCNTNTASGGAQITGTTTLTGYRASGQTSTVKLMGEVWRYTGSSGGPDEFIVRGRFNLSTTSTGTTASAAVSGISNRDKCIPFITAQINQGATTSYYDEVLGYAYIDGSNNVQLVRASNCTTLLNARIVVVEFTGANWTVGHGSVSNIGGGSTTINLNTASTGSGGSTFNVPSWDNAFIEATISGDNGTSNYAIEDTSFVARPGSSTSQVTIDMDTTSVNTGTAFAHVLCHNGMDVSRTTLSQNIVPNGSYNNIGWPSGAPTGSDLSEMSMEPFVFSDGGGTAMARGSVGMKCYWSGSANFVREWCHRNNNAGTYNYGVIDLSSLDGSQYIVITDVDTDEVIGNTQTNVVVTASAGGFESTQGTGKVELVQNANYTGTKVTQTSIDSWSDTSIQFDASAGALADTNCYLFVTNDSGDKGFIAVQVGIPPETYSEAVEGLTPAPSHHWPFQNSYADTIGTATADNYSGGTPTFSSTRKLVKSDTHSLQLDSADFIGPADQSDMNVTVTAARRYIGGWIQLDSIHQTLCVLYEEGAQVNNMAIMLGFGNIVMVQVADTGDDYAQAYTDVTLTPDRPYHVLLKFHASAYDAEVRCFLDGVLQARSNGNPWSASNLDTHSGNISWGHEGTEQLQVGDSSSTDNTDISFASPNVCNYAHWLNWTDVTLSTTQIRETLFEKGAPAEETISAGTESNMQDDMDLLADTEFTDWPCSIEIGNCTGGDFELVMDNITFEDRVSMQVRYMGASTLTLVTENGTVLDEDKLGAPYGGTIEVINAVPVTITVKDAATGSVIQGAMVLLEEDPGGTDIIKTTTDASGQVTANYRYSTNQAVTGRARKGDTPAYKPGNISGTITSIGLSKTVFLVGD
jgi:hypothetical protein